MKIKRQKRVNRILNFYKTNFGFHEPYQLLIDGTFCQTALNMKVNIREQMAKYLDGDVKNLTTVCAVTETENLGPAVYGAMLILKQFAVHRCGHEKSPISASKCLRSMVGERNSQHYLIASQDADLQKHLRTIPGTPLICFKSNAPILEDPSNSSHRVAESENSAKSLPSEYQMDILKRLKNESGILEEVVVRKRRRPKGPNPLSNMRKKKTESKTSSNGTARKRKRFRLRVAKHVKEIGNATCNQ